ncbi:MAG: nitroreductase family protein [Candidatus Actinomarina sp.]
MANEETYLQNLLANRKIVRNYIETTKEFPELQKVIDYAIKIPTAGFSRGIEFLHISKKENINKLAKLANEESYVQKGFNKWISNSLSIYLILINEKAYHDRYSEKDKKNSTQTYEWIVPYWYVDAGAAMMNCMLLIEEIGLKSGFLGSHNMKSTEIKSLMKIPESYQLLGFVTAGIEGKASSIKKNVPKKKITHYEYFNK